MLWSGSSQCRPSHRLSCVLFAVKGCVGFQWDKFVEFQFKIEANCANFWLLSKFVKLFSSSTWELAPQMLVNDSGGMGWYPCRSLELCCCRTEPEFVSCSCTQVDVLCCVCVVCWVCVTLRFLCHFTFETRVLNERTCVLKGRVFCSVAERKDFSRLGCIGFGQTHAH